MIPVKDDILKVVQFKTSRSGGSGGQHVNKVSSKVELILNIGTAAFLTEEEKILVSTRLANRLDQEGNLHVVAQEDRSQLLTKERAVAKMIALLKLALTVSKPRKPTKVPFAVIRKRREHKRALAEKKLYRKKPGSPY